MLVPVFLEAKLLGTEPFVAAGLTGSDDCAGRALYVSLLAEILPRALLLRLGLAKELLGSSGGSQFLVVIPGESIEAASAFLEAASAKMLDFSGGTLSLKWAYTENLGDWIDVRKRLQAGYAVHAQAPAPASFEPFVPHIVEAPASAFAKDLFARFTAFEGIRWDADTASLLTLDGSGPAWKWKAESGENSLPVAIHYAPGAGTEPATPAELAARARGRKVWGVLRGDVDHFGFRLRKAQTIEEHIQLSVLFKRFFAGELQLAASMGDFWQKISILYSGGDDFAVYGTWDALIPFAREIERLFHRFAEENLKDLPGPEGKTLSVAIALAESADAPLAAVYYQAGRQLDLAKASGKNSVALLGRTLEWKQLGEAAETKDVMVRLVDEFGCSPQFLGELKGFYRETGWGLPQRNLRGRSERIDRPWRFHRRLCRLLESQKRVREFQKARAALLGEFIGKKQAHVKLRPSGRVALEWARLTQEAENE